MGSIGSGSATLPTVNVISYDVFFSQVILGNDLKRWLRPGLRLKHLAVSLVDDSNDVHVIEVSSGEEEVEQKVKLEYVKRTTSPKWEDIIDISSSTSESEQSESELCEMETEPLVPVKRRRMPTKPANPSQVLKPKGFVES